LPDLINCITSLKRTIAQLANDLKATNQKYEALSDSIARMNIFKEHDARILLRLHSLLPKLAPVWNSTLQLSTW
jgi:hypothetical protein